MRLRGWLVALIVGAALLAAAWPRATYVPDGLTFIERQTPSGTNTLTFSNLGAFENLVLMWTARSDDSSISVSMHLTFNGDTGTNYDVERIQGSGTALAALDVLADPKVLVGTVTAATGTAGMASSGKIEILDYRNTSFQKNLTVQTALHRSTTTGNTMVQVFTGAWRSTAAITSISPVLSAGNFVSGSVFTLYGLK